LAATLLLTSSTLDWHLMFGGFGLAVVPLTIGTALLRHDTKLREQYREAARDVTTLERYDLAPDYVLEAATSIIGQKK
jgi:transketolase C-terminal domain/subunit